MFCFICVTELDFIEYVADPVNLVIQNYQIEN